MNWFEGKKTYQEMRKALEAFAVKYNDHKKEQTEEEKNTFKEIYKQYNASQIVIDDRKRRQDEADKKASKKLRDLADKRMAERQTVKGYMTSDNGAYMLHYGNYTEEQAKAFATETFSEIKVFGENNDKFANLSMIDFASETALSQENRVGDIQNFQQTHRNIANDPTKLTMEYLNNLVGAVSGTPKYYADQFSKGVGELSRYGVPVSIADPNAKTKTYNKIEFPKGNLIDEELDKNKALNQFHKTAEMQYSKLSDYVDKRRIFSNMLSTIEDKFDKESIQNVLFGQTKGKNKLSFEELNGKVNRMAKNITETRISSRADGKVHNRDKVNDLISLYGAYKESLGLRQMDKDVSKNILKQINKYRIHDFALESRGMIGDYIKQERAIDEISVGLGLDAPDRASKVINRQEKERREKEQAQKAKVAKEAKKVKEKEQREQKAKEDAEKKKNQKQEPKKEEPKAVQSTPNGTPNGTPGDDDIEFLDLEDEYKGYQRKTQEELSKTPLQIPKTEIYGEQQESNGEEIKQKQNKINPPDIID